MDEKLQELRAHLVALHAEASAIPALADDEKRDNTDAELARVEALGVEMAQIQRAVDAREKLSSQKDALARPNPRQVSPAPLAGGAMSVTAGRRAEDAGRVPAEPRDGRLGFRSFGDYALSVVRACADGGTMDRRLESLAPSNFASEASGGEGGFAVPPDFRADILAKIMAPDSLLARTDVQRTSSNGITIPVDENEAWGTNGVKTYWVGEGGQIPTSKPALREVTVKMGKVAALVVVTEELLEDAPALDNFLRSKVPQSVTYKVNEALLFGTGATQPLGFTKCPGKVQVQKVSGQAADTVVYANVATMWSRLYAPCWANAVWMVNQDVEPQLWQMSLATGSSSGQLVFMPPGGISGSPYATLFGRPVVPVENCSALGDEGDIVLADWSTYTTLMKAGGGPDLKVDTSVHLFFDWAMTAFRFLMRVGGQSFWSRPVSRAKSPNPLGNIVTLADRA